MNTGARVLIVLGVTLIVAGVIWQFGWRYFPIGHLPGDITIRRNGMGIYIPITTCVLASILLSFLMRFFR